MLVQDLQQKLFQMKKVVTPFQKELKIFFYVLVSVIMVTGGLTANPFSVEVFYENFTQLCTLKNLPEKAFLHVQEGEYVIGGTSDTVLKFADGDWVEIAKLGDTVTGAVSWRRPTGDIFIIGGNDETRATKLNGDVVEGSFNLKNTNKYQCLCYFNHISFNPFNHSDLLAQSRWKMLF